MESIKQAGRNIVSWALAGVLAVGLAPAVPASALAAQAEATDLQAADVQLDTQAVIPSKYDLRNDGVVTPVKQQSPWGSCWAFGGIAAAETSILSDTGTTYDETQLDLSEKHLAWYALHPITAEEEPSQAGEGIYLINEVDSDNAHAAYDNGGLAIFITSLFSSGTSPQFEEDFPYRGTAGLTELQYMRQNEDAWKRQQFEQAYDEVVTKGGQTDKQLRAMVDNAYKERIASLTENDYYSANDDWTIPTLDQNGNSNRLRSIGYLLKDGNVLPPTAQYEVVQNNGTQTKKWKDVDWDGVGSVKQELLNGHAVSVNFCADTSLPSQVGQNLSKYINLDNWAHYTYEEKEASPGCVGR